MAGAAAALVLGACSGIPKPQKLKPHPVSRPLNCSIVVQPTYPSDPGRGPYSVRDLSGRDPWSWWAECRLQGFTVLKITQKPATGHHVVDIFLSPPSLSSVVPGLAGGTFTTLDRFLVDIDYFNDSSIRAVVLGVGVSG